LAHHEIPDLRTLINIAQNGGIYKEHANAYMKQNFEKNIKTKIENNTSYASTSKMNLNFQTHHQSRYPPY